ncbi:BatD family protein [Christiangramia salexigens]|uniref:DUF4381 domain-containing protein n=1 Tax=Christiangramia salexigens TaxID=1913577 RepID=A0A1L3J6I9_9FLAO|nr:BatD family protein [Christiangramia salexigens]APG60710.1 DUF4381 domain-containing protein [Christiangramia salexigens]
MKEKNNTKYSNFDISGLLGFLFFICLVFSGSTVNAQENVNAKVDTTSIKIGEQIRYKIDVSANSDQLVVFPEGNTFSPLELLDTSDVDTISKSGNYRLLKEYFLTQFDSGKYVIPRQEILIENKTYYTDSIPVEVRDVVVDTTKQKLYPIKPSVEVSSGFNFPVWLWWILGVGLIAALVGYFLIRRKKKAETEPELPPYEQAMAELQKLDSSQLLEKREIKEYYSQLSFSVRKYLDRKIYDHGLESTTNELILYLETQRTEGKLNLSDETIRNFQKILQRADLAKFANSKPDIITAKEDRTKSQQIIEELRESVPEPTEEELQKDKAFLEEQAKKKQKRRIIIGVLTGVAILIIGISVLIATKGITYVKDTYLGHPTKELLEGDWIRSEYGNPPVLVTTPKVLVRGEMDMPQEVEQMMAGSETFMYGSLLSNFYTTLSTIKFKGEVNFDLKKAVDGIYTNLENQGARNIIMKQEDFTTINGAKGLKVFGSLEVENPVTGEVIPNEYVILNFAEKGGFEQVIVIFNENDQYAQEISNRIINSVELINLED